MPIDGENSATGAAATPPPAAASTANRSFKVEEEFPAFGTQDEFRSNVSVNPSTYKTGITAPRVVKRSTNAVSTPTSYIMADNFSTVKRNLVSKVSTSRVGDGRLQESDKANYGLPSRIGSPKKIATVVSSSPQKNNLVQISDSLLPRSPAKIYAGELQNTQPQRHSHRRSQRSISAAPLETPYKGQDLLLAFQTPAPHQVQNQRDPMTVRRTLLDLDNDTINISSGQFSSEADVQNINQIPNHLKRKFEDDLRQSITEELKVSIQNELDKQYDIHYKQEVEKVIKELHEEYSQKHTKKITSIKESYTKMYQGKIESLQKQISELKKVPSELGKSVYGASNGHGHEAPSDYEALKNSVQELEKSNEALRSALTSSREEAVALRKSTKDLEMQVKALEEECEEERQNRRELGDMCEALVALQKKGQVESFEYQDEGLPSNTQDAIMTPLKRNFGN